MHTYHELNWAQRDEVGAASDTARKLTRALEAFHNNCVGMVYSGDNDKQRLKPLVLCDRWLDMIDNLKDLAEEAYTHASRPELPLINAALDSCEIIVEESRAKELPPSFLSLQWHAEDMVDLAATAYQDLFALEDQYEAQESSDLWFCSYE